MYVVLEKGTLSPISLNCEPVYPLTKEYAKLVRDTKGKKEKRYKILKDTGKKCPKCGSPLFRSFIKGYSYQCFSCDEDFYRCEI